MIVNENVFFFRCMQTILLKFKTTYTHASYCRYG